MLTGVSFEVRPSCGGHEVALLAVHLLGRNARDFSQGIG